MDSIALLSGAMEFFSIIDHGEKTGMQFMVGTCVFFCIFSAQFINTDGYNDSSEFARRGT